MKFIADVKKSICLVITLGLLFSPVSNSQTIESGSSSAEESLFGNSKKAKEKTKPKSSSNSTKPKTAKAKPAIKKTGPTINITTVDDVTVKISECINKTGALHCKGIINTPNASNFSVQCYSGSYMVADGREIGCQSVTIGNIQNWSYVAVGLSAAQDIPFDMVFSNTGLSFASAINLVVSTKSQRNKTLNFKNISLK